MDYSNPGAMLPTNDYHLNGGLGGLMAGLGIGNNQAGLERSFRDSDLGFLEKQQNYQNLLAETPAKRAEYDQRFNKANMQNEMYQSGLPKEEAVSDIQTKISSNEATQSDSKMKQLMNKAHALEGLSQELQKNPVTPGVPQSQEDIDQWQNLKDKYGPTLPGLPAYPSTSTITAIHSNHNALINDPKFQQAMAKVKEEEEQKLRSQAFEGSIHTYNAEEDRRSHERIAAMQAHQGLALEEAKRAMARGTATQDERRLVLLDFAARSGNAIMNSTAVKLSGLDGDPKKVNDAIESVITGLAGASRNDSQPQQGQSKPPNPQMQDLIKRGMQANPGKDPQVIIDAIKRAGKWVD